MKSNRDQLPPIQAKSVRHRAESNRQRVANAAQIGRSQSWQRLYGTGKLRAPALIRARPGESQIDNAVPSPTRPRTDFGVFRMDEKHLHSIAALGWNAFCLTCAFISASSGKRSCRAMTSRQLKLSSRSKWE